MNSDVIAVFATVPERTSINNIAKSPIEFYTHSTVSFGVKENLWQKVGKAPVDIDLPSLVFKYYRDQEHVDDSKELARKMGDPALNPPFHTPYWEAWALPDEGFHSLSLKRGLMLAAEDGSIYPAQDVIHRIEHGHSKFKIDWPSP